MPSKNKYTPKKKFEIVLKTLTAKQGEISTIAREESINANMISKWRSEFKEKGHIVFDTKESRVVERLNKKIKKLTEIIGKKEVELDVIKNFTEFEYT